MGTGQNGTKGASAQDTPPHSVIGSVARQLSWGEPSPTSESQFSPGNPQPLAATLHVPEYRVSAETTIPVPANRHTGPPSPVCARPLHAASRSRILRVRSSFAEVLRTGPVRSSGTHSPEVDSETHSRRVHTKHTASGTTREQQHENTRDACAKTTVSHRSGEEIFARFI